MNYRWSFILQSTGTIVVSIVIASLQREKLSWLRATGVVVVAMVYAASQQRRLRTSATNEGPMIPAGSGWSFFLQKRSLRGRPIYAKKGMQVSGRWGAGTKIKDLQKVLTGLGLTLSSYPSIENGTIGGWIASGSHGSGGTLWRKNFGTVLVRNLKTNEEITIDPEEIFHKRATVAECRNYFILEVEITPHTNVWCKRSVSKMSSVDDYDEFITRSSYLRVLQIGRRGVLCLLWVPVSEETTVKEKKGVMGHSLWFETDILSILQSNDARNKDWFNFPVRRKDEYDSRVRLAKANQYTMEPNLLTTPIGLFWINFEVFVLKYKSSAKQLSDIANALCLLFDDMYGRCELRLGSDILFLDFNVSAASNTRIVFEVLHGILNSFEIVLHRGKAQVDVFPFEIR